MRIIRTKKKKKLNSLTDTVKTIDFLVPELLSIVNGRSVRPN